MTLSSQIDALPQALLERLRARGFDRDRLVAWASLIGTDRERRNRLLGRVEAPSTDDIAAAPPPGTPDHARFEALGREALARGEVALCVLAGGMATRMGGVVKALVEALPGKTFLELRLAEHDALNKASAKPVPLWLMTSEATDGPIRAALGGRLDGRDIATFEQCVSLRLTPNGDLFYEDGEPSVYATGHGDLPDALRTSGLLDPFVERGGRVVWIANLDNLGATVDAAILGWHLSHASPLTVEVVDKVGSDRGGVPIRYEGRRIIAEEFRLPIGFDPSSVRVFNTNTFLVDAAALRALSMSFTYVEVEKTIKGQRAIQFERLLGEISMALEPRFLRVPRQGGAARFLPVKDVAELEQRRADIAVVARTRLGLGDIEI